VERTVVEFAEALVFVGMLRWYLVRKLEEEESEGFSWNEIEAGALDFPRAWLELGSTVEGTSGLLHLFELVYN
jgi:hypothetical protein